MKHINIMGNQAILTKSVGRYQKKTTQNDAIPQALVTLTLDKSITKTEWTSDTGA
jgi:hypothetical protein